MSLSGNVLIPTLWRRSTDVHDVVKPEVLELTPSKADSRLGFLLV